jgi:diguanylate cyclase (GGDEF)-like protein
MASPREILVLIEDETKPDSLVRPASGTGARLRVKRWGRLAGEDLSRRGLEAVVFKSADDDGERRLRRKLSSMLPRGVARIALTPRGSGRALNGRGPGADLHLSAPVDLRILTALLAKSRRCRELEEISRRSRRVVGELSRYLKVLGEITRNSNAEFEPKRIMDMAMLKIRKLCPVDSWSILLVDEEKSCLVLESAGGAEMGGRRGSRLGMGEGLAGRVLRARAPILISRQGESRSTLPMPEIPERLEWSGILGLPLLSRGKAIGAVELIQGPHRPAFRRRDVRALSLLLEPVAIAIENALLLKRSEELSITDDLTKLFNSRYLNSYLLREVQRSRRYGASVSLIFLDLDGFKNVNDGHGHLAGSRALVEVGAVIRNMVREIDVVSRFGGDEFTIILPQTGPEGAKVIAERMRVRIEETVFLETFGLKVRLTASFGIACFPDHGQTKDALIQKADQAMYRVKGRGKNGVELAD